MFKSCYKKATLNDISRLGQEEAFYKYTGIFPDLSRKYCSLFRSDKRPGCRFRYMNGILFFVDNVPISGKTHFNIVDTVMILKNLSFEKAIQLITNDGELESVLTVNKKDRKKEKPEIRFDYVPFKDDNYFKIDPSDLQNENVFNVRNFWIKKNGIWKSNHINSFTRPYAYYFPETDHVKLYWPTCEFKWYSNCDDSDIFGEWELDSFDKEKEVIITKSQKDRLILKYKHGKQCIAVQQETNQLSNSLVKKLSEFSDVKILFDNDETGILNASIMSERYGYKWYMFEYGKDAYENYLLNIN